MASTVTELMVRRMGANSGSAIDWERIARGMTDGTTEFEISSSIPVVCTDYFFAGRTGLTKIVIPEGVTKIGERCFSGCTSLTSITLPSTLTEIGKYFTYSSKIESITVPASVTKIGNYFLPSDKNLKEIIMLPTTPPVLDGVNLVTWGSTTYTIYVPDNSVSAYQTANNWSTFASKIKGISERPT